MKKIFTGFFVLAALCLSFAGCSQPDDPEKFNPVTQKDIDSADEWLTGKWEVKLESYEYDISDGYFEKYYASSGEYKDKEELIQKSKEMMKKYYAEAAEMDMDSKEVRDRAKEAFKYDLDNSSENTDDNYSKYYLNGDRTKIVFEVRQTYKDSGNPDMWFKQYTKAVLIKK